MASIETSKEGGPMPVSPVDMAVDVSQVAAQVTESPQEKPHINPESVLIPLEEFAEDLELRLGRANGNVFQRKPGLEGVHDGQIMVRLKKKRFIVIDYGVVPTESDLQAAALNPHIATPEGAGKQKCITPECTKIGVPVLLYDSEPNEPASLYMRSGLCFTCQRVLNEKRRTQRKRKSDIVDSAQASQVLQGTYVGQKKFKSNGEVMEISSDAIIINGPVGGAKALGEGYGFQEIGVDLLGSIRQAASDSERFITAVSNPSPGTTDKISAVALAAAAAVAAASETETPNQVSDEAVSAANAAVEASTTLLDGKDTPQEGSQPTASDQPPPAASLSSEDVSSLYEKAFLSMTKAIFQMTQWKASWDAAVAAAVAQETVNGHGLADAVASAAAVAASTAEDGTDQSTTNMIPLLLAAEAKGDNQSITMKEDNQSVAIKEEGTVERQENPSANGGDVQVVFGV